MASHRDDDEMVQACIDAGRLVMAVGSPRLQTAMRLFLIVLGREIAERIQKNDQAKVESELLQTIDET